ncbi:hypothetical protein ACFSL4_01565 [Streptomyces caeni]|uniref:Uncharacterized protein n=1 Tax=Streptomyces caeni TaxID=2307231 RepID=A0ABW4II05_9ACTN
MTPIQVFTVAVIGAFAAVLSLIVVAALAAAVYTAASHLIAVREAHRERRRDLKTCRAIHALGTTDRQEQK